MSPVGSPQEVRVKPSEDSSPKKLTFCFQAGFFMLSNRHVMGQGRRRRMTLKAEIEIIPDVNNGNAV